MNDFKPGDILIFNETLEGEWKKGEKVYFIESLKFDYEEYENSLICCEFFDKSLIEEKYPIIWCRVKDVSHENSYR